VTRTAVAAVVALFTAAVMMAPAGATEPQYGWWDGVAQAQWGSACVTWNAEVHTYSSVGFYAADDGSYPAVGDVFYGRTLTWYIGNNCSGYEVPITDLHLPGGVALAVGGEHRVRCFLVNLDGRWGEVTDHPEYGDCMQQDSTGLTGGRYLGGGKIAQGWGYEIWFPLVASKPLHGMAEPGNAARMTAGVKTAAGTVWPHQDIWVAPAPPEGEPPSPPPAQPDPDPGDGGGGPGDGGGGPGDGGQGPGEGDGGAGGHLPPPAADDRHAGPPGVHRYAGAGRIDTAVEISRATFSPGVPVAFVATAGNFPDALAGGPAAGTAGGPILLTNRDTLPEASRLELDRLRPARIVVLGGAGAVSETVREQLQALTPGAVDRIAGTSRFDTASAIADAFFSPGVPVAFVATGANFPDALAGGAAAAFHRGPVLLVQRHQVPAPVRTALERLQPQAIVVLGGEGAVSAQVLEELRAFTAGDVTRLAGTSRFETATRVVAASFPPGPQTVFVATGASFPDALAGVPAASAASAPLLLVERDRIPAVVDEQLKTLRPARMVILGGAGAVSATVEAQLAQYLR
jgi:putative cell wall-binding protein